MTANRLCNRRRMEYAALRLRHRGEPLDTIIADCGFATPAQFNRRFREQFGTSPAIYREGGEGSAL